MTLRLTIPRSTSPLAFTFFLDNSIFFSNKIDGVTMIVSGASRIVSGVSMLGEEEEDEVEEATTIK